MKLLKEEIKKIIREELEKLLNEINRRDFLKGAAAMCAMGVQAACKQDYELHNTPSRNLDGMEPPDCLGKINLIFRHHDFENGGIPEDFFIENYKELESDGTVEVTKNTGQEVGAANDDRISHTIRVLFKSVPEASTSWDEYGLRDRLQSWIDNDGGPFHLQGEPFLIRSFAFHFPVANGMVYANTDHIRCAISELGAACNNWMNEGNWQLTFPVPVQREDATCEGLYKSFLEGPLEDPEAELNELSSAGGGSNVGYGKKEEKLEEMFSSSGMMGMGSGRIPADRSPEGHKKYIRMRFRRQGNKVFKPNRYFAENSSKNKIKCKIKIKKH